MPATTNLPQSKTCSQTNLSISTVGQDTAAWPSMGTNYVVDSPFDVDMGGVGDLFKQSVKLNNFFKYWASFDGLYSINTTYNTVYTIASIHIMERLAEQGLLTTYVCSLFLFWIRSDLDPYFLLLVMSVLPNERLKTSK